MWGSERAEGDWRFGDARNETKLARRINEGWEEGAERIRQLQATEMTQPKSVKRHMVRADQGDSLDIHAVYRGDLNTAWRRTKRDRRPSPAVVRVVAVVAGSCMQSPNQFFYRGAAVAKLTDLLTQAGYSVEVVAACVAQQIGADRNGDYCHTITLKHSTAPLDLSQLAAVLCQQGFVRYYMFKSFTALATKVGRHFGWYGSPTALNKLAVDATTESNVRTFTIKYTVDSPRAAQEWVEECIRSIEDANEF
jgi:hypothetical protein